MRKSSKLFAILSTAMFVTALGTAPCYAEEVPLISGIIIVSSLLKTRH